ncbi:CoaE Dephospho-CoA kinase [uncultured Caudovirales phage]|uniref:CoaE Dephospho-CoA kinase n=1 Tax=uncultured Caudovirales phage TaxID=2100421 RepID=A0A6J5RL01_9CAUD|nr:CoaE Dephospho-CoA kinase [uncultured Caudovirales phage]
MITVGLTGNIACGKSTISKTFKQHNIPVIDADIIARQVVEQGTIGLYSITAKFGKEYLCSDGTLDRAKLGKLVFSNKLAMDELNLIMGPLIDEESEYQIAQAHKTNDIVVYDAALIIENGHSTRYNPLIVVSCPIEIQLARLMKRNSLTRDEAMARICSQIPTAEKIKFADYVIDSSSTIENSRTQTEQIISNLKI